MDRKKTTGDDLWRRVADLVVKSGKSEREVADDLWGSPSAISRARTTGSMPGADRAIALANYFNVPVEWLILGAVPKGDVSGLADLTASAVDVQDVSLVGFLSSLRDSGMAKWAGMVPIQSSPTLLEAARALKYLHEHPQYSNENGVPLEGWPAFFEKLRATNFQPMKPAAKPQKTKAIAEALDGGNMDHEELTAEPPKRVVRRAK